jgi:hypothetical protein
MSRHAAALALAALTSVGCGTKTNPSDGGRDGSTDGVAAGSVCDPAVLPDGCLAAGLACTPDYTGVSPTGAFCELPGPFYNCFPSPGCAGSLVCVDANQDAGVPGGCLASCNTTAEGEDPLTACGQLGGLGPSFCLVNNCSNFWQPCAASLDGGSDGTCVYLYDDPTAGPEGACLQGGAVPMGNACNFYRRPTASLCASGGVCMINYSAGDTGVCLGICDDVADGGPTCLADCVAAAPPAPPPATSLLDYYTQVGGCAQDCTASPTCAPGLICQQVGAQVFSCLP